MELLAADDADGKAGLYVATHDPPGSTKDILVESRPAEQLTAPIQIRRCRVF